MTACVAGCVQSFMLAQKCRIGVFEFWQKFVFPARTRNKIRLNCQRGRHELNLLKALP